MKTRNRSHHMTKPLVMLENGVNPRPCHPKPHAKSTQTAILSYHLCVEDGMAVKCQWHCVYLDFLKLTQSSFIIMSLRYLAKFRIYQALLCGLCSNHNEESNSRQRAGRVWNPQTGTPWPRPGTVTKISILDYKTNMFLTLFILGLYYKLLNIHYPTKRKFRPDL